jgi:hypothetical protein
VKMSSSVPRSAVKPFWFLVMVWGFGGGEATNASLTCLCRCYILPWTILPIVRRARGGCGGGGEGEGETRARRVFAPLID